MDGEKFLCRAICPELSGETVSLKEITAARNARRKQLRGKLTTRTAVVDTLLAAHNEPLPAAYPTPGLRTWSTPDETTTVVPGPAGQKTSRKPLPATGQGSDQSDTTPTHGDAPRLKRYWTE
ncbi:hypothetical protein [Nonomuraea sp. NPDC049784]|uniref:hypothetical protein n=1 Tax=Nonomuraea sp. NPDC049784 TaxID=3154361 RepID=UPI0033E7CC17